MTYIRSEKHKLGGLRAHCPMGIEVSGSPVWFFSIMNVGLQCCPKIRRRVADTDRELEESR